MRNDGIIALLLLLASGCATTRVVNLDMGRGTPIVYHPVNTPPIEIDEVEFKGAVAQLVLGMNLNVAQGYEQSHRFSLLASAGGLVDGAQGRSTHQTLAGELTQNVSERHMRALSFAFDTVWEGVEGAIRDVGNPAALRAMVVSMIGTALVMLVAPEPMTKLLAIALTASLIAYLGTGPVWNLGQGFLRLVAESKNAHTQTELKEVGHRFGRVLGGNGTRVLVIAALSVLGGRVATAAQGPRMPGAAQAALRAQLEGGFELFAAQTGGVQAIALPSAGVLNVALAPAAVAAVAMGPGQLLQGDPEGDVHHICTNKNEISEASGGPWTPQFERYFKLAKMTLNDLANQVRIKGHKGPHAREYHQAVLDRIASAMQGCRGAAQCRAALVDELAKIARDLTTAGTALRKWVTKSPGA